MLSKEHHAQREILNNLRDDFYSEMKKFNEEKTASFIKNKDTMYRSLEFCMGIELCFDMIFRKLYQHEKNLFKNEQELKQKEDIEKIIEERIARVK